MSLVGIDFGSHTASIALWSEEKNTVEVLADDLGSRTIPSAVAFRGDEIITGQSAISQMHKNPNNTFDDVRTLLLNPAVVTVPVPQLEKDLTVQELSSHFFRNIHNQIKQQVGSAVRDCVVTVPYTLDADTRKRLTDAAQAGGMRVKACIDDSVAALMAHQLDDASFPPGKTLVLDIGWSQTNVTLYNVSGGMFLPVGSSTLAEVSGKVFVKLVAAHCAKDFARKAKFPCDDNKRSMLRLSRECENAMKTLSTGAEAMIDIDSLCEGVDFSHKLSRARFEDLLTIPFMQLKNGVNALLAKTGWLAGDVRQVCMSGGGSSIPRVISSMKAIFAAARFPVGRFESLETQCIGAALHGKFLSEQGLLENAPATSPVTPCLTRSILLSSGAEGEGSEILATNTVLPATIEIPAVLPAGQQKGYIKLLAGAVEAADSATVLGEVVFEVEGDDSAVVIAVSVSVEGEITVEVTQTATKVIVGSLTVAASA
jgi:heat shock protein 1/8